MTSYLQILELDHAGRPRELPNHGTSLGSRIHRVLVNRWHLVKRDGQWWVERRTLLPIDLAPPDQHQQRARSSSVNSTRYSFVRMPTSR